MQCNWYLILSIQLLVSESLCSVFIILYMMSWIFGFAALILSIVCCVHVCMWICVVYGMYLQCLRVLSCWCLYLGISIYIYISSVQYNVIVLCVCVCMCTMVLGCCAGMNVCYANGVFNMLESSADECFLTLNLIIPKASDWVSSLTLF